jgi:hypothetical protein
MCGRAIKPVPGVWPFSLGSVRQSAVTRFTFFWTKHVRFCSVGVADLD